MLRGVGGAPCSLKSPKALASEVRHLGFLPRANPGLVGVDIPQTPWAQPARAPRPAPLAGGEGVAHRGSGPPLLPEGPPPPEAALGAPCTHRPP